MEKPGRKQKYLDVKTWKYRPNTQNMQQHSSRANQVLKTCNLFVWLFVWRDVEKNGGGVFNSGVLPTDD